MNLLILVIDDEPDVEALFRQQFRRELRAGRFAMEFAQSAPMALQRITNAGAESLILILSDINMPGMSGLELLPEAKAVRPDVPIIMITAYGDAETKRRGACEWRGGASDQADRLRDAAYRNRQPRRTRGITGRNSTEFAAVHESACGTNRTWRSSRLMSVVGGRTDLAQIRPEVRVSCADVRSF